MTITGNGDGDTAATGHTADATYADQLQHHDKPGSPPSSPKSLEHEHHKHRFSVRRLGRKEKGAAHALDWGLPGELTKDEVDVFMKFRVEVEKRGGEFRNTVYCFGEEEGEAYALCRWLRARKFVYKDVIAMVEKATEVRADARKHDFYPDPNKALGCDPSVFISQYPQLYSGSAKNGCPLFISKPGILNVDGMECITTLEGILKFHWHVMMHDFANQLRINKEKNPDFVRFECVCVLDLDHLTTSQLSNRALGIIKTQTAIDSDCFPETMNRMVIVNAPRFFTLTWKLIKGWIDARTANKVEIISSRSSWEKRLRELVDENQLPSDYGGKGESTTASLLKNAPTGAKKQNTELLHVRSHASSHSIELKAGEELDVTVYTRATSGATFTIVDAGHKKSAPLVSGIEIVHKGKVDENVPPTVVNLTQSRVSGPVTVKIKADSKGGRFSSAENFLLVWNIYDKSK